MNDFMVRIFQPGIPEYRVGLFERIGKYFGDRIEIFSADSDGLGVACRLSSVCTDYSHTRKKIIGNLIWQKGINIDGLKKGDVIVVCGDIHYLSTLWVAFKAKLRGVAIVWWTHHKSATSTFLKLIVRIPIVRLLSTVVLCYTREGRDFFIQKGFLPDHVFYTGNTIDESPINSARSYWTKTRLAQFVADNNLQGKKVILFCSVLRPKAKLYLAIDALQKLALVDKSIRLVVIGDGEERDYLMERAKALGVSNYILWKGRILNQMDLAPWFMVSKVFVYPGAIGLSLIHAFFFGLPVIVHDNPEHQMPEYSVMQDGQTGYLFVEDNVEDLANKISYILNIEENKRRSLGQNAEQIAHSSFSMDGMAARFIDAINMAHSVISMRTQE